MNSKSEKTSKEETSTTKEKVEDAAGVADKEADLINLDDGKPAVASNEKQAQKGDSTKDEKSTGNTATLQLNDDNTETETIKQTNVASSIEIMAKLQKPQNKAVLLPPLIDVAKFDIHKEFKLVNNVTGYLKYVPGPLRQIVDAKVTLDGGLKNIAEDTVEVFKQGLVNVRYGLNKDKLTFTEKILNDSVAMSKEGLVNIGGTTEVNQNLDYINGTMAILLDFVFNNEVYAIGQQTTVSNAIVASEFKQTIVGNYTLPVGAHLAIASTLKLVDWVDNVYERLKEEGLIKYQLGRVFGEDDPYNSTRSYQGAYMNIDQFAAQLYNLNLKYLRSCTGAEGRLLRVIEAYADRRVDVTVDHDARMSLITDYESSNALSVLTLGAIMSATLGESLVAANEIYFAKANIFRRLQVPKLIDESARLGSETLFNFLNRRMNGCDYGMINRALAMETMPAFTIHCMVNAPKAHDLEGAIATLMEFYLVHLLTPDLFENLKGDIGNIILDCASKVSATDVQNFKDTYGYRYSIVNGTKRFKTGKSPWRNDIDYFSEFYPSVFADDFGLNAGNNIVIAIMEKFKHNNPQLYDCARAREAGAPRIDGTYTAFLPFAYSSEFGVDYFSTQVQIFIEMLRGLVKKSISNGMYKGSASASALHNWFLHVHERAKAIDATLQSHLALAMETRSEAYCNFYKPFKGVYTDFKRQNVGLISNNKIFGKLYHLDKTYQNRCATVNTAFVWHILCGSTSIAMDRLGINDTQIPASLSKEVLGLPSPKDMLSIDMGVLSSMREMSKAVGIVSTLFSEHIMSTNVDMMWFRGLLRNVRMPNAMFNLLVNLVMKKSKSSITDYGRVNFADHISSQRSKLQDPMFRRITNLDNILDFDPNIDPEAFRDIQSFLTELELERMDLGLKFVHRQPIQKVSLGVRLLKKESATPYPGDKPDIPDDYQTIETSDYPNLFIGVDDNDGGNYAVNINGTMYSGVTEWPKLHVKVVDRRKISRRYRQNLLKGFEHAGWIIDLLDVAFIPKIVGRRVDNQSALVEQLITERDSSTIEEIEFTDSALSQGYHNLGVIPVTTKFKYIYPLNNIIRDYVVSGYGNMSFSDEPPLNFKVPDEYDFDSGAILPDKVTLMYSMPAMETIPKVDSNRVSMSNIVHAMISNVEYTDALKVTIGESPDFINISESVSSMYAPE